MKWTTLAEQDQPLLVLFPNATNISSIIIFEPCYFHWCTKSSGRNLKKASTSQLNEFEETEANR